MIARHTGFSRISFGGILKKDSEEQGLSQSREALQDYGQSIIDQYGYDGFLQWAIEHSQHIDWNEALIIDGLRHYLVYESMSEKFKKTILIYCDCSTETQIDRIVERDKITPEKAKEIISHETEKYVSELEFYAHIIYRPGSDTSAVMAEIDRLISDISDDSAIPI